MQLSKTLLALFLTACSLASAYTEDDSFGGLYARDLHADEKFHFARSAAAEAHEDYLEARDEVQGLFRRVSNSFHLVFLQRFFSLLADQLTFVDIAGW